MSHVNRIPQLLRFVAVALLMSLALVLSAWVSAQAASSVNSDLPTWRGWVEARPSGAMIGTWVIGGRSFQADANTEFDQEEGPLVVGACAKVKYQTTNGVDRAVEIDSEPASDCGSTPQPTATASPTGQPTASPTATMTPTPTGTPGDTDVSVKARVDSMPASGLIGTWVIGGVTYTTDANTTFRQDNGPFAVGVCVEVEYSSSNPSYAKKIATKSSDDCGGSGGGSTERELYGVIQSFPAGLIGEWQIGGLTFVADAATQFEQERIPFAVGVLVEVHFTTDAAGVNRARKIETKSSGGGSTPGQEGHAFGAIEAMPSGSLIGPWRIGGVDYTATANTRFEQQNGPFAIGAQVKVEYRQAANGTRTATKIETLAAAGNPSPPQHAKVYGYVQQRPATGYVGEWVVGGVAYTADQTTRFVETNGLLAVGAYVEVEYVPGNGNWIYKLETHVPPGAGNNNQTGVIQQIGTAGRVLATTNNAIWVIDGVRYQVTPATVLDDSRSPLTVGSLATINSYADGNGNQIATQIRGVTLTRRLFLPMLTVRR